MYVVDRKLEVVRQVTATEWQSLVDFETLGSTTAAALLRRVHSSSHWFACDCATPMPVLNIALHEGGKYVIRNNPTCGEHAPGCPFRKAESIDSTARAPQLAPLERIKPEDFIPLHAGAVGGAGAAKNRRALALLYSLIERAGLNVYEPSAKVSLPGQYAALRDAARHFNMAGGTPLGGWLETRISPKSLVSMSIELRQSKSATGRLRWGALLDLVDGDNGREILSTSGKVLTYSGRIEREFKASPPALALITVAEIDRPNYFELCHFASIPVLGKNHLFPVTSHIERAQIKDLFGLLDWMQKSTTHPLMIRRNIFDPFNNQLLELRSKKGQIQIDLSSPEFEVSDKDAQQNENLFRLASFSSMSHMKKAIAAKVLNQNE